MKKTITDALHKAMKEKDSATAQVLRLLNAALLEASVKGTKEGVRKDLDDDAIIQIIDGMVKKCRESLHIFREHGREDKAQKEEFEIKILEQFLPQRLSEEETTQAVAGAIKETGAQTMRDMGKVMAHLTTTHGAKLDKGRTAALVKKALSS